MTTAPARSHVNTRNSLWSSRWPAIAHRVLPDGRTCIETVESAPPTEQADTKMRLPCGTCEKNTACLNARAKELGTLLYGRELLTMPRTSESSLFPAELFAPLLDPEASCVPYYLKPFLDEHHYAVATAWDLAFSEKTGGDWLAKVTGIIDRRTGLRQVIDVCRWQQISFDDQIALIQAEHALFRDDMVIIESDAAQQVWTQHLRANSPVPVVEHSARGKKDFASGVPGLLVQLEQGMWRFPYQRGSHHHEHVRELLNEAEAFGWVDGKLKGVGEHDDLVMAWYHASWGLDRLSSVPMRSSRRGVVPGARQ